MKNISKTQQEYYDAIVEFYKTNGYTPSIRELGKVLHRTSPATTYSMLLRLEERGLITFVGGNRKIIKILNIPTYKELERNNQIKDAWCQRIIDIGFDYDGYNQVDSLKHLIDELVEYSKKSIKCDDKSPVYYSLLTGEETNILDEEL